MLSKAPVILMVYSKRAKGFVGDFSHGFVFKYN